MYPSRPVHALAAFTLLCSALLTGCSEESPGSKGTGAPVRTLTLGAYTTPREAYGKAVIPAFQAYWRDKTGEEVRFEESYLGSGAQARVIVSGFEADVAALSLEADVDTIARAGLITHDWRAGPHQGMITRSIVVIAVPAGNPQSIHDWDDLRRSGMQVLTPNVRTSGGAMWNVAAIYGAALRGGTSAPRDDAAAAQRLLADILRNVSIMDKGARESIVSFEKGLGDAAITYENEVLVARQAGKTYDYVVPRATILIENPAAVIDVYADKHGTRDLADAFVAFLASPAAQRAFTDYGLRPVDASVATAVKDRFPAVADLFTIHDLGGWPRVNETLFAPGAVYDRIMTGLKP
jgi:sulfate/thiosulfate transport system substrate-binding protein